MQKNEPDRWPRTARDVAIAALRAAQPVPPAGEADAAFARRAVLGAATAPAADDVQGESSGQASPVAEPLAPRLPWPAPTQAPAVTPFTRGAATVPATTLEIRTDEPRASARFDDLLFRPSDEPSDLSTVVRPIPLARLPTARGEAIGRGAGPPEDGAPADGVSPWFQPPARSRDATFFGWPLPPRSTDPGFFGTVPLPPTVSLLADRAGEGPPDVAAPTSDAPRADAAKSPQARTPLPERTAALASASGAQRSAEGPSSSPRRILTGASGSVASSGDDGAQKFDIHVGFMRLPSDDPLLEELRGLPEEFDEAVTDRVRSEINHGNAARAASNKAARGAGR